MPGGIKWPSRTEGHTEKDDLGNIPPTWHKLEKSQLTHRPGTFPRRTPHRWPVRTRRPAGAPRKPSFSLINPIFTDFTDFGFCSCLVGGKFVFDRLIDYLY